MTKKNDKHAAIRHDLKNEITVIKAFSELIKRNKNADPRIIKYSEKINEKADKLNSMIDGYLRKGLRENSDDY